jgi:NAD(P)-dependent dehydrogenase (short-subunit alcohol dehydrogenase family)
MKNYVSLITGGAGHLGSEVSKKLAANGSNVIVVDKNDDAGNAISKKLQTEYGVRVDYLNLNLLDSSCFSKAYEYVNEKYGKLNYLVNCAAFYDSTPGWGVPFEQESYEAWMKVFQVNTLAPFFLTQKLSPLLKKSESASIVNVSSIYGILGPDHGLYEGTSMTNPAAYGASKGGLQQITMWLSTVLAPQVRVNTVTPGGIERGQNEIFKARYEAKTPLKRMANEDEIADAILFLLYDHYI